MCALFFVNRWFGIRVDLLGLTMVTGVVVAAFLIVEFQGKSLKKKNSDDERYRRNRESFIFNKCL